MEADLSSTYKDICGYSTSDVEYTVTVGVIDSVFELQDWASDEIDVKRNIDELSRHSISEGDTTSHGTNVVEILNNWAVNVEFNLYRVTQETGPDGYPVAYSGDICNAIFKAVDRHDVDLLNVSLGCDHSKDGHGCNAFRQPCKLRQSAQDAIKNRIAICASAGNEGQADGITCPSYEPDVVSVGGVEPLCSAELTLDNPVSLGREQKPPMAGWMDKKDGEDPLILCTGRECAPTPDHSCAKCRNMELWDGNVEPEEESLDIYAPHRHLGKKSETGERFWMSGTSWAAPKITAALAEAIAGLKSVGEPVYPGQLRRIINESGKDIGENGERIVSFEDFFNKLADENGLQYGGDNSEPGAYSL